MRKWEVEDYVYKICCDIRKLQIIITIFVAKLEVGDCVYEICFEIRKLEAMSLRSEIGS